MKKVILTIFNLLFVLSFASAQANMVSNASFDKVSMAAYQIEINIAPDRVIDLWDDFWDDRYGIDVDREDRNRDREIYLAKEVTAETISEKQIDIYSSITTGADEQATVSLGFGVGYDVYASKAQFANIFAAAERILNEFETYSYQKYYGQIKEEQQKKLEEARDEKADLEQDIAKNESQVERWQEKIESLEKDIQEAREENEAGRKSITEKTESISALERELREAEQQLAKWQ